MIPRRSCPLRAANTAATVCATDCKTDAAYMRVNYGARLLVAAPGGARCAPPLETAVVPPNPLHLHNCGCRTGPTTAGQTSKACPRQLPKLGWAERGGREKTLQCFGLTCPTVRPCSLRRSPCSGPSSARRSMPSFVASQTARRWGRNCDRGGCPCRMTLPKACREPLP